ncbi:MAG: hypothetical protein AUI02_03655 [Acidobacteria bacterium 13_2_20CM_2_57_12]|nr:MAG: hypothetical protein AUH01_01745 [Acidobacteria bacterium 13_2_20CM_56_17]OLB95411.1 MAG: hypothetical protein AUI02_03655 [Acidobacteria bacterium 13_2_20CM_2_57_12]
MQAGQPQSGQQPSAQASSAARPVGTIKSISGNTIILTTDAGSDVTVQVQDSAKLVRIAPGQKDLKDATPIQLGDLQPGDRILVRGKLSDDGKSVAAASVIAMKKVDIADKQSREREEWQRHGFGGLVNNVDAGGNTINVSLPSPGEKKTVAIHFSKDTILRRYASDSVKFDDAKPAPLDQIKTGDQLRARGTRSADGATFAADEIVSGTFRNIAGVISALDASAGTVTVQDLALKKSVTVKITADSQLRKLPPPIAQRIAARLKGTPAEAPSTATTAGGASSAANSEPSTKPNGPPSAGSGSGGMGRSGGGGSGDLQQAISRMPAATLVDLQKGDAVMVVATEGGPNGVPTVITLLGGVEPILEASPKSSASTILSPWSLGTGAGGEAATP